MFRKYQWLALGSLCLIVLACTDSTDDNSSTQEIQTENAWATVNGSPLTDAELEYSVNRFFGNQFVDARAELKIRDSLIASRALAQKAQAELDPQKLAELEVAVQAYKEERLIAVYIESTADIEPVSARMVSDYYQSHLAEFGAVTVTRLHIMEASVSDSGLPESEVSKALYQLAQSNDWSTIALPGYIKQYRSASNKQLSSKLKSAIQSTPVGELSGVVIEGDKILVFKSLNQEQLPPKPLAEVSADIRKRLAATQLRKIVKKLTDQVVSESDVVRHY